MCRVFGVEATPRRVGKSGATPVACSCFMCGNPRRHWKGSAKHTLAERRAAISDAEERAAVPD